MHANDILKYGHLTLVGALETIPPAQWQTPDVCGVWSVKDIVAHLASYELVLTDILNSFLDGGATPMLDLFTQESGHFNDDQVAQRRPHSPTEVLDEYKDAAARNAVLIARIPAETCRRAGALPWYGAEYDLDDFLVYTFYGHKREHAAQIHVFKDELARAVKG
ncbi:MAG: maleylpyruvate isomerase N-terminal domain-containing protein [Anaerolineae bacterium]|nr:maleylpyruvate isomerase N-terminal domain-containing protein [Anaerolineae bacterium]